MVVQTRAGAKGHSVEPGQSVPVRARRSSGGDSWSVRFGMREFRFDTATRRAYLNGKIVYLRGASITLHRFFGDPLCGGHPLGGGVGPQVARGYSEANALECISHLHRPAPQQWLDMADEAGLLLQYEFPIWDDRDPFRHKLWKEDDLTGQFWEFMRDNWNHPSLVIWDASNETQGWEFLREKLVPIGPRPGLSAVLGKTVTTRRKAPTIPTKCHPYRFDAVFASRPLRFTHEPTWKARAQDSGDWHARPTPRSSTSTIGYGCTATERRRPSPRTVYRPCI